MLGVGGERPESRGEGRIKHSRLLEITPAKYSMGTITLGCTLFSYLMMNRWQKFVTATEAGLIYCLEPVCASIFALFMPVWLSSLCGVLYANETLTMNLLVGSLLVTLANVLLHWPKRTP